MSGEWVADHSAADGMYRTDGRNRDYPEYNPRTGDHLWVGVVTYRIVDPDNTPVMLDEENRLAIYVGCFYCERQYRPVLKRRRCPGVPAS